MFREWRKEGLLTLAIIVVFVTALYLTIVKISVSNVIEKDRYELIKCPKPCICVNNN